MRNNGHKQAILDYVTAHPGVTAQDVQAAHKKMPSGTISGRLSKFTTDKVLKRTGEPGAYRYFLADADVDPQLPLSAPRKRRARKSNGASANVLISVAVGKNHTETMSIEDARAVWKQLSTIFAHA
jgi:hypothetical protein